MAPLTARPTPRAACKWRAKPRAPCAKSRSRFRCSPSSACAIRRKWTARACSNGCPACSMAAHARRTHPSSCRAALRSTTSPSTAAWPAPRSGKRLAICPPMTRWKCCAAPMACFQAAAMWATLPDRSTSRASARKTSRTRKAKRRWVHGSSTAPPWT